MKAVLISIKSQWVEKILNGEKTVEVRKTRPKLKPPFKGLIYCTKAKEDRFILELHDYDTKKATRIDGKVVGEFICDKIIDIVYIKLSGKYIGVKTFVMDDEILSEAVEIEKATCLTQNDLLIYGQGKDLYGIHISDLKIYDRPKELSEFKTVCKWYNGTKEVCDSCLEDYCKRHELTRPPQSWCYV